MGIEIGMITIPWYGLCIALGVMAGVILGYVLTRIYDMKFDDFIQIACFTGLGAMVGSKLLYLAVSWKSIDIARLTDLDYLNTLMGGGFVFYGGLVGGFIGLYLCGRFLHIPVLRYAQTAIPVIPLVHAFGRVGCALVGCCYGIPYNGPGAVIYTESAAAPTGVPLFPVQTVEASANFVLAAVLSLYVISCRKKKKKPKSVQLYLVIYSILRFVLEFMRYDDSERGILLGLSTSQWISIVICLIVIILELSEIRTRLRSMRTSDENR